MKKLVLLSMLFTTLSHAQVTDETGTTVLTGNIGVGVAPSSSSDYKLEVNGAIKGKKAWFLNTLPDGHIFSSGSWPDESYLIRAGSNISGGGLLNFYDIPQSNYHTYSRVRFSILTRDDTSRLRFFADQGGPTSLNLYDKNQNSLLEFWDNGNDVTAINFRKEKSYVVIGGPGVWPNNNKLTVRNGNALIEGDLVSTGNVGIGTSSFTDGSDTYKLSVEGKVRAHEIKVYTGWADFVFEPTYNLPTLEDVENYINKNGHLKDIPSAEEVEENGVDLGEMNKLLLQKIEELTLYTIELKKEVEALKAKVK